MVSGIGQQIWQMMDFHERAAIQPPFPFPANCLLTEKPRHRGGALTTRVSS
jgi:hypothetical protein